MHSGVALAREQPDDLGRGESGRDRDVEGHHDSIESGVADRAHDRLRRVAAHRRPAAPAVQHRRAREQQLQVVVELGHGADGRARGPHRIGLIDGDRGRDPVDATAIVEPGLVHPVEELAGVRGKRLDVAALPLAVHGVEGERGLAGPAYPGDDMQLPERQVEIDALEVVLPGAADADGGTGGHGCSARARRCGAEGTSRLACGYGTILVRRARSVASSVQGVLFMGCLSVEPCAGIYAGDPGECTHAR